MSTICKTAEQSSFSSRSDPAVFDQMLPFRLAQPSRFGHSIADSAVQCAIQAHAKAIITFTTTSETSIYVSKGRPPVPIFAITPNKAVYNKLALFYGIYPTMSSAIKMKTINALMDAKDIQYEVPLHQNTDTILAQTERDIIERGEQQARECGPEITSTAGPFLQIGDVVVYCAGSHPAFPGLSNSIKIAEFGSAIKSLKAKERWQEAIKK
jgi:pyruvate kinase